MNIINVMKENALKHPERIIYEQANDLINHNADNFLTWGQLWEYSGKLAEYIKEHTMYHNPIIVLGNKHPYMLVCFLACMRAGHAYCPVDVSVPEKRVQDIIDQVDPEIILCTEELALYNERIVTLSSMQEIVNHNYEISDAQLLAGDETAYIIFTSGSTGVPKGVKITRNCIENFVEWAESLLPADVADKGLRFLNQAPYSFDLSVMDTYLALFTGGTVVALDKETQSDMKTVMTALAASDIDVWVSTPSFAEVCLTDRSFNKETLNHLKMMLFCGEVLSNKMARRLLRVLPDVAIVNTYGPTESTVAITNVTIDETICDRNESLPVGVPKPGTIIEIQDENGNVLPENEKGEIVVIGDTVSTGYWKNEEKTHAVFGTKHVDGKDVRFYRTGDAGYISEGNLYCSGRIDLQLKLYGYRLELEDIERNLIQLPYIAQVCVCPMERNGKVVSLTAVLVLAEPIAESDLRDRIRQDLADLLPSYMIPKKYVSVDYLPLTLNGKMDRKAIKGMIV
ncbi:D-alanine--poly(phosphoribitol) ligase subunit DltA [Allofustis seminis]|uniref:D-alanine--poly(phosphoribitol) ligase subunit DltA n=1 Tax=Allofustis seminis TaxID=166939 RepID=UPI00036098E1|nr:D-alanine--poly(phosphoribitol) ligase subunit DltA [Allofustis seminis]